MLLFTNKRWVSAMIKRRNQFVEYVRELLEPFGTITYKAMFGGFGIYKNGIIFAIIAENELYFKADARVGAIFEQQGSEQFSYDTKKGKRVSMCYWRIPPEVLDDTGMLAEWCDLAYGAATRGKGN